MTKRYFYSDPLAAAWMAKHFGMTFENGDSFKSACEVAGATLREMPFVVHPDSQHLLEPKVGDVLLREGKAVWVWQGNLAGAKCELRQGARIVQRDGKAFFWPESEEV